MITIYFKKSRSKKYKDAVKNASLFANYEIGEESNVKVLLKEVFEKWQFFSELFWIVIPWKGTHILHDRMDYHSSADMKVIFYALQQAHTNWINITEHRLIQTYKVYDRKLTLDDIDSENMTDEEINQILDVYNAMKRNGITN